MNKPLFTENLPATFQPQALTEEERLFIRHLIQAEIKRLQASLREAEERLNQVTWDSPEEKQLVIRKLWTGYHLQIKPLVHLSTKFIDRK